MRATLLGLLLVFLLSLISSCVTIRDATTCSVAGKLADGAICSHTLSSATSDMTLDEFMTFLEPASDHGAAICMSLDDWGAMKTELETACKELADRCSYATQELLRKLK